MQLKFTIVILIFHCPHVALNLTVFATGTAAELVPIARLATGSEEEAFDVTFPHGTQLPGGPVTTALLTLLREVMVGEKSSEGTKGWLRDPFASRLLQVISRVESIVTLLKKLTASLDGSCQRFVDDATCFKNTL
mmetsp:Transcript_32121/g.78059  ORF Transcript_32121/g.78059 Transcript_32121/m.78059 type:complete len:135 (+) Transcript_32121:216-620(+)